MTFDYSTLKRAAKDGIKLGNWYGKAVFAASVENLKNLGNGVYYILYDDKNKIVARTDSGWKIFGEVTTQGSVNEYNSACNYKTPAEAARKVKYGSNSIPRDIMMVSSTGIYSPGYDRAERPVGDVKTEIDVEKTLKMAREMTVENLLEGFLPGLNYDVAAKG